MAADLPEGQLLHILWAGWDGGIFWADPELLSHVQPAHLCYFAGLCQAPCPQFLLVLPPTFPWCSVVTGNVLLWVALHLFLTFVCLHLSQHWLAVGAVEWIQLERLCLHALLPYLGTLKGLGFGAI